LFSLAKIAIVPDDRDDEIGAYKENLFTVKGEEGYWVEYKTDASGKVTEALLTQP